LVCSFYSLFPLRIGAQELLAQTTDSQHVWHGQQRVLRYHPEGRDLVITNGNRRFTRALYGGNTAFRVEAGDLPEFAMYMPGMGGNIKFGIIAGQQSKWLIKADTIVARYQDGSMLYQIQDPLLGKGKLFLKILALHEAEGTIIEIKSEGDLGSAKLICVYGGATGKNSAEMVIWDLIRKVVFTLNPSTAQTINIPFRQINLNSDMDQD